MEFIMISFDTPMASFSGTELSINRSQGTENQESCATSDPKRHGTISSVNLEQNDGTDDEENRLFLHYDSNRLKQEKLLIFTNIFRVLIICIVACIMYFLV
jgi:hypothetical protein